MASNKQSITAPFSRMENGLSELQRWWPAYVKNDGVGGLSVDPVLFRSTFGPQTRADEGGLNDEANTPGVRVEAIDDDGTEASGSPTITISGAGTLSAKATITHADASTTIIRFIAPSAEITDPFTYTRTVAPLGRVDGETESTGPFPVMMTVQEFAEMVDTYRHVGEGDESKKSWLPHGLTGNGTNTSITAASALPTLAGGDTREPTSSAFPATAPYRATVFMPMMLDVNQFDKRITNASNDISEGFDPAAGTGGFFDGVTEGVTRYDADPEGDDSSDIRFKTAGYSGDHLTGSAYASQTRLYDGGFITKTHINPDISLDSSAVAGPKYRMRMALAMFLKNGTYSLKGGVLIPYTYDPDRTIGGSDTVTVNAVWNGLDGSDDLDTTSTWAERATSAQIWPLYDFVQGPIAPGAQASNFDVEVMEGVHRAWPYYAASIAAIGGNVSHGLPRQRLVRPNPKPATVAAVERASGILTIWLNFSNITPGYEPVFSAMTPIFLYGLDGDLGTGATNAADIWRGRNDGTSVSYLRDHNGWWLVNDWVVDTFLWSDVLGSGSGAFSGARIKIRINSSDATAGNVSAYTPSAGAFVCQGRIGGYEDGENTYGLGTMRTASDGADKFNHPSGFQAGLNTPGTTVPSSANHDHTSPGRVSLAPKDQADDDGVFSSGVKIAPRSISIVSADDARYSLSPTVQATGGGVLRIPPGLDFDYAMRYYSVSQAYVSGTYAETNDQDALFFSANGYGGLTARWFSKGVWTPLWSFVDNTDGRHAWDYVKPVGVSGTWTYGRNRPWPGHERCGTRLAYTPSLLSEATGSFYGWSTATVSGNRVQPAQATTKYGLTEIGCSPVWLDMEMRAFIPVRSNRMTRIEFDTGFIHPKFGKHGMVFDGLNSIPGRGYTPIYDETGTMDRTADASAIINPTTTYTVARSVVWAWGDASFFASGWDNVLEWPFSNVSENGAFGSIGNGYGTGGGFAISEGVNTIRTVFTEAGMNLLVNGTSQGTDANSNNPVWGLTIECADAGVGSDGTTEDNHGNDMEEDGPTYQKSQADLQIDELTLRHIPSPAMLPFTVDTMKQDFSNVARYTGLTVEAENISTSKGMNIKATIMTPSGTVPESEGLAPVSGFENVDLAFAGGIGTMDLTGLPSSVVTSGFVVRFLFYIPSSADTDLHPINWSAIPIIRSFTVEYDQAPTATLSVIGNTFNGDTTAPIDTKVGHIISFRATATTADTDRTISQVKFDFGDGSETAWLDVADQTLTSTSYDTAHSYLATGTYAAVCYSKDDAGNVSSASASISVVVANAAPIAILRAVPSLVRAGQSVTLDGSGSYDINAGGSIATYTFTFGDGSSSVSGSSSSVSHTYAEGGEFRATLVVEDGDSTSSQTASAIIKVLPATLVVPLVLNTKPRAFTRTRNASMTQTPVLDSVYPEVTDMGQRTDEFTLTGSFLKATANDDIAFMEELMLSGALIEIVWEEVNFVGTPTGKTFVGRMTSFDYQREGGKHGETPYTATFVREAGLGA